MISCLKASAICSGTGISVPWKLELMNALHERFIRTLGEALEVTSDALERVRKHPFTMTHMVCHVCSRMLPPEGGFINRRFFFTDDASILLPASKS